MKASIQISSVSFDNTANQSIIQNLKGVDSSNIINQLELHYMEILSITYQDQKGFFTNLFGLLSHEEHIEQLLVHSLFDIRIAE